ncbi:MAG: hypothetical protein NC340_09910 [Ruminococcus flavefaciens]|nr:hypothetical protein [Ruminococcus flavefaciens]MCM1231382.1 hypothetical protein [Ruminococcus flavefaciens]
MKKNNGNSVGLRKSTKVTILSCVSFVLLTLLILVFFVFFPITPSEKIMASIGRENIFNNNPQNNGTSPQGIAVTTDSVTTTAVNADYLETGTHTTKTYEIVITTGSGFMWNGRIPDEITGNTKTTIVIRDDPTYPTYDPGYVPPVYPSATTAENNENPDIPVDTTPVDTGYPVDPPATDPVATDIPPATDPVWTEPPVDTTPVRTEPPIIIDTQPPVNPDPPVYSEPEGGEVGEW